MVKEEKQTESNNEQLIKEIESREDEIDLMKVLIKIKSLWYIVVICMLAGVFIASAYSIFIKVPYYSSSSMVYIRGTSSKISMSDLEIAETLTNDYEIIFKSRPNLEKVISKLKLNMTTKKLSSMISITNPEDTRILQVSVTSTDPNLSKNIVNEVVSFGMNSIREIDSQEPYLVESGIANTEKLGYSIWKVVMMGAVVGLIVSIGGIFIYFVVSDRVASVEDIEDGLGIPVLTVVSEDRMLYYSKRKSNKKAGLRHE